MCSTSLYSDPGTELWLRKCKCATQQQATDAVSSQQLRTSCRRIYSCNATVYTVQHRRCCCVLPPACSFRSAHSGSCHHVIVMLIISVCLRNKLDTADWSVMCHIYLLMVEFLCLLSYCKCTQLINNNESANMLTDEPTNLVSLDYMSYI
jgi:hypothetical protein